jgi:16S rRNA (adenine1518-N6/adenine1519-N6)-dimethyltransferase
MNALAADGLPPLREVIARHGLSARKALGQNFLMDLNLTARIARVSGPLEGATVVEVGPGPGGLTRALLAEGAARVIAIERDTRCLAALDEISAHYPGRLEVIAGDALEVDLASHLDGPARIVANLPYNVGTELFVRWMSPERWPPWWDSLTCMFQREVAERIVARPGSGAYGRLSVLAQWRARARIAFDVNPGAFTPPPKVTSSVLHVAPAEPMADIAPGLLERVVAAAFAQRRKMLRQSLKTRFSDPVSLLEAAGIDPTRRAETLSIEEFLALCRAVAAAN